MTIRTHLSNQLVAEELQEHEMTLTIVELTAECVDIRFWAIRAVSRKDVPFYKRRSRL